MKRYHSLPNRRHEKAYALYHNGEKVGEYTTVDGCYAAAKRKGWTWKEVEVKSNY